ncbi:MAG: response regulator [Candidatus Hydrogenedentes bacterium]|nr:response regulator [Candidatus Hydrogenedentota bacterium]
MTKILLVDDDADLAELVETKLVSEGHEVFTIHTGEGAFELAKKVKPDIALLDIMLPAMTGYQICRKIRKDPELYSMAVLIITALGEEPELLHGLEQGADDYIVKPFKLEKLMEKLSFLDNLRDSITRKNPTTNLPGTDAIKREINHRLARGISIAVCYIDIQHFKPFCAVKGKEGQTKTLVFTGKLLTSLIRSMGVYESFTAHIGGEHFAVLLNVEDHERFCSALIRSFDHEVKQMYTPDEVAKGQILARDKKGREGEYPLMSLAIGVAHNEVREYKSANKIFEVLAQIRQRMKRSDKSSVFVDRRNSDR